MKSSISRKLTLSFSVITSMVLVLFSATTYGFVRNKIVESATENQKNIIGIQQMCVESFIRQLNSSTISYYVDTNLYELLFPGEDDTAVQWAKTRLLEKMCNYFNMPLPPSDNLASSIHIFLFEDIPLSRHLPSLSIKELRLSNYAEILSDTKNTKEDWYQKTVQKDGALYLFRTEEDKENIYITRLLRNPGMGYTKPYAIVMIKISEDYVRKLLKHSILTKGTTLLLKSADGQILYSNVPELAGKEVKAFPEYQNIPFTYIDPIWLSSNGQKYLISNCPLDFGLSFAVLVPNGDIMDMLALLNRIILCIFLVILILGILIIQNISKRIAHPIRELSEKMAGVVNRTDIKVEVEYSGDDEVGALYSNFLFMMQRINTLIEENYEAILLKKTAELDSLQSEINSHFTYNTLDSISWIAIKNKQYTIVEMVSGLSAMLRYCVQDAHKKVTLGDELQHIGNYMRIQRVRYQESIEMDIRIEEGVRECVVPKLCLQPIIENSIVHGFSKSVRPLRIEVEACRNGDRLELRVADNGIGADVERLTRYINGQEKGVAKSKGFGLRNIQQRIQLDYGNEFSLKFENNREQGLRVILSIPEEYEKQDGGENGLASGDIPTGI